MKFLALLAALMLEQAWPLRQGNPVHLGFGGYAQVLESRFNGGQRRHGVIAWLLAVLPVAAAVVAVYHVLHGMSPVAAWLWNIAVLYLTMGFRRFSHYFTEIQQALRAENLATARESLGKWRGESASWLNAAEIARVAIEQGLLASHRHVFGTLFWFVALGPAGAVLYHASAVLAESWGARADAEHIEFGRFASRAFFWIDWVPARLTAASFAVVGDFEDAAYCWRTQAAACTRSRTASCSRPAAGRSVCAWAMCCTRMASRSFVPSWVPATRRMSITWSTPPGSSGAPSSCGCS